MHLKKELVCSYLRFIKNLTFSLVNLIVICIIGLYQLLVTNLVQPQSNLRLIWKLDSTCLSNLKKWIKEDPSGPGVLPVAVLCIDIQKR